FDLLRLQGYINVCAGITLPNVGSEKLHLSLGFKPIGAFHRIGFKNGSWHDVLQMEMPLAPHPEQPAETQAFSRIENSP
ncbi:GNAT family N-acetyltransferase, partial [Acinetobacter baumannii]